MGDGPCGLSAAAAGGPAEHKFHSALYYTSLEKIIDMTGVPKLYGDEVVVTQSAAGAATGFLYTCTRGEM